MTSGRAARTQPSEARETTAKGLERLHKVLANAGVASRRKCEELIAAGRVSVNGRVVTEMGAKVDAEKDEIRVDGKVIRTGPALVYILLHKPPGVVTSKRDPAGRDVLSLLKDLPPSLNPVGRLDAETEGLLLLTNDGALHHRLTHPSFQVLRTYRVLVDKAPDADQLGALRGGVMLSDVKTGPAHVRLLKQTGRGTWVEFQIGEGKRREVRRAFHTVGLPARRLIRVAFGPLQLGRLARGKWRRLSPKEIRELREFVGLGEG